MNSVTEEATAKKVLIVDDTPANIDVLKKTLEVKGYEISFAPSGEIALKVAPQFLPNIILLDIMMPGIDGFETCNQLKKIKSTQGIPVIFISAKHETQDIVKGFECGGADFVAKPFQKDEVLARVKTHIDLQILIKEKEHTEAIIKNYADELERSNKDLEDFAFIASHDLQAPLRRIQAFSSRFCENYEDQVDERGREYLARLEKSATKMQDLITNLLNYSRVSRRKRELKPVDLNIVVSDVLESLEIVCEKAQGKVEVESLPVLEADDFQMRQLFQNLISNGLKFHKKGVPPVVRIQSQYLPDKQSWQISVKDNGIGFDEKYLDRIFKPFERLQGSTEYEGTGIGTAISEKIVQTHSGTITARSRVGEGSEFIVCLPERQGTQNTQSKEDPKKQPAP